MKLFCGIRVAYIKKAKTKFDKFKIFRIKGVNNLNEMEYVRN